MLASFLFVGGGPLLERNPDLHRSIRARLPLHDRFPYDRFPDLPLRGHFLICSEQQLGAAEGQVRVPLLAVLPVAIIRETFFPKND